jgi:hypothetical protein
MRPFLPLLALASLPIAFACSDDADTDGGQGGEGAAEPETPCERAWYARCKKACECQPGDACTFAPGVTEGADGSTTVHTGAVIADEASCRKGAVIECYEGGGEAPDFDACIELTESSTCETFDYEGTQYTGVVPFAACDFH